MKTAIVLGATGGAGKAMVSELLERGIKVIAFGRTEDKLKVLVEEHHFNQRLAYKLGDIFDYQTIVDVAKDADVMFQCANVKYQEMEDQLQPLGEGRDVEIQKN